MTTEKGGEGVRAVDRALDILLAFKAGDRGLTASEVLKRVDLSRPTLYRLLRTLELRGFVASSGEPQQFQLGPAVAHLAHVWTSGLDMATLAQPMMHRLWEKTGETVALLVQQGRDRICVAELPSAHPLSFKRGVGHRERITLGASGKVVLAFSPDAEHYLAELVTDQDRQAYRQELTRIQSVGYAVSKDELIQGAVAVAAPFFTGGSKVMGSLVVYGPSARVDESRIEKIVALLLEESSELSKTFGL
ncbi:IclR family transcriptional regulator [Polaromonas sp. AER18D-145]|uniref:IclR family transcriptional regulator n=1 Tax=Polaromonas sp. AER18D-145 TaxID=1977060 RepID=UPI000BBC4AC0|nr:IclR family transcriptional regulator [Polaromonas sp. AER18D-145]